MTSQAIDYDALHHCAEIIRHGGLVVFPTETVYGIACDGTNPEAVKALFEAKERPFDKPLLAHLYSALQAKEISYLDARAMRLIKKYAPGPLTLIVRKKENVPSIMTSGGDTVGLRFPAEPVGLCFMRECGCMLAATSANISGNAAGITGEMAAKELMGRVDAVIDVGPSPYGVPSTIISVVGEPKVIREGAFDLAEIQSLLKCRVGVIGLCGRSGSGKGQVGALLRQNGYTVIDTDAVYHEMISAKDSEITRAIADRFGDVLQDGVISRDKLRNIVFNDAKALQDLNTITHKYILDKTRQIIVAHDNDKLVFVDAPLLFESGFDKECDAVVCVWAEDDALIKRITERDGISLAQAQCRLAKQPDVRAKCDYFIDNSTNLDDLKNKVNQTLAKLLAEVCGE